MVDRVASTHSFRSVYADIGSNTSRRFRANGDDTVSVGHDEEESQFGVVTEPKPAGVATPHQSGSLFGASPPSIETPASPRLTAEALRANQENDVAASTRTLQTATLLERYAKAPTDYARKAIASKQLGTLFTMLKKNPGDTHTAAIFAKISEIKEAQSGIGFSDKVKLETLHQELDSLIAKAHESLKPEQQAALAKVAMSSTRGSSKSNMVELLCEACDTVMKNNNRVFQATVPTALAELFRAFGSKDAAETKFLQQHTTRVAATGVNRYRRLLDKTYDNPYLTRQTSIVEHPDGKTEVVFKYLLAHPDNPTKTMVLTQKSRIFATGIFTPRLLDNLLEDKAYGKKFIGKGVHGSVSLYAPKAKGAPAHVKKVDRGVDDGSLSEWLENPAEFNLVCAATVRAEFAARDSGSSAAMRLNHLTSRKKDGTARTIAAAAVSTKPDPNDISRHLQATIALHRAGLLGLDNKPDNYVGTARVDLDLDFLAFDTMRDGRLNFALGNGSEYPNDSEDSHEQVVNIVLSCYPEAERVKIAADLYRGQALAGLFFSHYRGYLIDDGDGFCHFLSLQEMKTYFTRELENVDVAPFDKKKLIDFIVNWKALHTTIRGWHAHAIKLEEARAQKATDQAKLDKLKTKQASLIARQSADTALTTKERENLRTYGQQIAELTQKLATYNYDKAIKDIEADTTPQTKRTQSILDFLAAYRTTHALPEDPVALLMPETAAVAAEAAASVNCNELLTPYCNEF